MKWDGGGVIDSSSSKSCVFCNRDIITSDPRPPTHVFVIQQEIVNMLKGGVSVP